MEVVLYFSVLQVISTCLAYDIEIEGVMRVGDEFLKKLNDDLYESRKVQSTTSHPEKRIIRPVEIYTGAKKSRKTGVNEKKKRTHMDSISHSFDRMKTDGFSQLDKLQVFVSKHLKLKKNISNVIHKAYDEYSTTLDKYLDTVTLDIGNSALDVEFLLLDLVETSNKLLYSIQRGIFNQVVDENRRQILKSDINKVTEIMFKQSVNDKKRQMELICKEHRICRPFPGFIDYFADLISEILKLSDDRLTIFLKILQKALYGNVEFLQKIIDEVVLERFSYHLHNLSVDIGIIRDIISMLRTAMTQRHNVIHTPDDRLRNRTSAAKILFDIVDKAFENDGEEMVAMNIDIVVEVLRHWVSRAEEIESVVTNFVNYVFNVLKQSIGDDTKKEIKILTEIILRGQSKNRSVYNYLLTKGSKFVRGEDLHIYSNLL